MISNSKQNWTAGQLVKVGFLANLLVVAVVPTPGDYAPDAYVLSRGQQFYSFVPHKGLSKIALEQAAQMVGEAKLHAERMAAAAVAKADALARHAALVAELAAA